MFSKSKDIIRKYLYTIIIGTYKNFLLKNKHHKKIQFVHIFYILYEYTCIYVVVPEKQV